MGAEQSVERREYDGHREELYNYIDREFRKTMDSEEFQRKIAVRLTKLIEFFVAYIPPQLHCEFMKRISYPISNRFLCATCNSACPVNGTDIYRMHWITICDTCAGFIKFACEPFPTQSVIDE